MGSRLLPVSILAAAMLAACSGGQQGQFVVTSHTSRSFHEVAGGLTVLRGGPLPLAAVSDGETPLMYVLVVAPGVFASQSGWGASDEAGVTTCDWRLGTPGTTGVKLTWDRRTDRVSAGGRTFDRKKGNAFVLIRDASGKVAASQVGTVGGTPSDSAALQQMQAALPPTSAAKGVTLEGGA